MELIDQLGGEAKAGKEMKTESEWMVPAGAKQILENVNGTNSSKLSVWPAGYCDFDGACSDINLTAVLWSSTDISDKEVWCVYIDAQSDGVDVGEDDNNIGMSVRCVKD